MSSAFLYAAARGVGAKMPSELSGPGALCSVCGEGSSAPPLPCGHAVCVGCQADAFSSAERGLCRGEAVAAQLTLLSCAECRVEYADAALPRALAALRSTLRRVAVAKLRDQGLYVIPRAPGRGR